MAYLAFSLATLLASSGVLATDPPRNEGSRALATLRVSIATHNGIIPAAMANGRPVYKFAVIVSDAENRMWASDSVLLQTGMTRQFVSRGRPSGQLRGLVAMDRAGAMTYRVAFRRDGRDILSAATYVVLSRPLEAALVRDAETELHVLYAVSRRDRPDPAERAGCE